jgi:tryptophan-rich sensory protein
VWYGSVPRVLALPFALNILTNIAFTPLQFGLQIPWLALLDVVAVIATLVWGMVWVWPYARWVVWMNIPYLLWGTFAFVLQFSIVWLNS